MTQLSLTDEERARVGAAVEAAEAHTAGEIVTVIANRSDGYTDVALAWAIAVAFTALAVLALFTPFYIALAENVLGLWGHAWTPREVFILALGVGVTKFIAMMLLQLWQPLKFFLVPGPIRTARVHAKAVSLFKVGAERRTHGRTGILIYLSMREHRAEIVADEAIAGKVPAETWGAAMAAMLGHIKQDRVTEGMVAAVEQVGLVLAEHFPRAEDDVNELPDRLIEL